MSETVEVTVAAGESVTISPHPSGLPQLPPLVLYGGDKVRLPLEEAERLYQQRKVLGMRTGTVKPPDPVREPTGPAISFGNGPPLQGVAASMAMASAQRQALNEAIERDNAAAAARDAERDRQGKGQGYDALRRAPVTVQMAHDAVGAFSDRYPWEQG